MSPTQRVYLDVCCLNRPFDDQTQERIRLEAEAILLILERLRAREWEWSSSEAVDAEIERTPDSERRARVRLLASGAHTVVMVADREVQRAQYLESLGFRPVDALHLACAEAAAGAVFLRTDDRLLRRASRLAEELGVPVANPLAWLQEVMEA